MRVEYIGFERQSTGFGIAFRAHLNEEQKESASGGGSKASTV